MDIIFIIKAIIIGSMSAGGFYFLIALLVHYFPLPLFIKTQNVVDSWTIRHYKTEEALDKTWNIGKRMAQLAIVTMWLVLIAAFTYLLYKVLSIYLPIDNTSSLFLYYYLIAIALPLTCLLFKVLKYWWGKKKNRRPSPPVKEPPRKTLLEQMTGE